MRTIKDLTGQRFYSLIAQWPVGRSRTARRGSNKTHWLCICDCGNLHTAITGDLTTGNTKSCGRGSCSGHYKHGLATGKKFPEYNLFHSAKKRAAKKKIRFTIALKDIIIPKICPLLGIPLSLGTRLRHRNSPSLDRIKPELGYTKGNIQVISWRANQIKNDSTLTELETIVQNWRRQTCVS